MAMTLRLDEATSVELRALSQELGRSQQQLVHEAVRDFVERTATATREKKLARRKSLSLAKICGPNVVSSIGKDSGNGDELVHGVKHKLVEPIDPLLVAAREGKTVTIDGTVYYPPVRPVRLLEYKITPPPGGVMALLDREDRI